MRSDRQNHSRCKAAIFLDKDGTLVEDVPFNVDPAKLRLYPEVVRSLRRLESVGYKLIVVSNQPGIAHGYFERAAVDRIGEELRQRLSAHGVRLHGFHYCPHHPEGKRERYSQVCDCRKPAAGLLRHAAALHGVELSASWMIGDILNDVEAGNRAGCRTVLVDRGNETEWVDGEWRKPRYVVRDMNEASRCVIDEDEGVLKVAE